MALSQDDLFKAHTQNLRAVDDACDAVQLELRRCIAIRNDKSAAALLRTYLLLIAAWAEVRLLKVLHEPTGFSASDRQTVLGCSSQTESWQKTLEIGFRRHYNVPNAALSKNSLPITTFNNYQELHAIVASDLRPIVEVRNRLAHGQWARMLNNAMDDYSPDLMAMIAHENALSATFKRRMIDCLSQLTHNLVSSPPTFERDFNKHYRVLQQARTNLSTRSYGKWVHSLRAKLERGKSRRST